VYTELQKELGVPPGSLGFTIWFTFKAMNCKCLWKSLEQRNNMSQRMPGRESVSGWESMPRASGEQNPNLLWEQVAKDVAVSSARSSNPTGLHLSRFLPMLGPHSPELWMSPWYICTIAILPGGDAVHHGPHAEMVWKWVQALSTFQASFFYLISKAKRRINVIKWVTLPYIEAGKEGLDLWK
jgi:hypothetical protein